MHYEVIAIFPNEKAKNYATKSSHELARKFARRAIKEGATRVSIIYIREVYIETILPGNQNQ